MREVLAGFHAEHERAYGFAARAEATEVVNIRVTAIGKMPRPALSERQRASSTPSATSESRPVYFAEVDGFVECAIVNRYGLTDGDRVAGPAIVEEFDSTTVIHPGYAALVDGFGNLLIRTVAVVEAPADRAVMVHRRR